MTTTIMTTTIETETCPEEATILASSEEPRLIQEKGLALQIAEVAQRVLSGLGYRLVWVKIGSDPKQVVQISVERPEDGLLSLGDCERITYALSPVLDVEDLIRQKYQLEIGSPGLDRVLVRLSDFIRAIGHEVKVETAENDGKKRLRSRLKAVTYEEDQPQLVLEPIAAEGADSEVYIPLCDIIAAQRIYSKEQATPLSSKAQPKKKRSSKRKG